MGSASRRSWRRGSTCSLPHWPGSVHATSHALRARTSARLRSPLSFQLPRARSWRDSSRSAASPRCCCNSHGSVCSVSCSVRPSTRSRPCSGSTCSAWRSAARSSSRSSREEVLRHGGSGSCNWASPPHPSRACMPMADSPRRCSTWANAPVPRGADSSRARSRSSYPSWQCRACCSGRRSRWPRDYSRTEPRARRRVALTRSTPRAPSSGHWPPGSCYCRHSACRAWSCWHPRLPRSPGSSRSRCPASADRGRCPWRSPRCCCSPASPRA